VLPILTMVVLILLPIQIVVVMSIIPIMSVITAVPNATTQIKIMSVK